jgi:hypothetical protein
MPGENGRVQIELGGKLCPESFRTEDREQSVFEMTCAIFSDLERKLREAPWHWIYWGNVRRASSLPKDPRLGSLDVRQALEQRMALSGSMFDEFPELRTLADHFAMSL